MRLLYLSCHSVLEFDEITLFHEMGIDVFSHGAYSDPERQGDGMRRPIPGLMNDPKILDIFRRTPKEKLTEEMVEPFDTVMVMSMPRWITGNWEVLKRKRVIWRCIGQNNHQTEASLKFYRDRGLQIVRYSPKEATLPGYIGADAFIRFYKDPSVFGCWSGQEKFVVNFTQSMKNRGRECNFNFYRRVIEGLPCRLFGPHNENIGQEWAHGAVDIDEFLRQLRINRAYFYTGTYPASYTLNFVEAWMTGIPVLALGPERGNDPELFGYDLYEVSDLIRNGQDGFFSDDEIECRQILNDLLRDPDYARAIGEKGRRSAIDFFGKEKIKAQWAEFLIGKKASVESVV